METDITCVTRTNNEEGGRSQATKNEITGEKALKLKTNHLKENHLKKL
jgi:hypothetical protein